MNASKVIHAVLWPDSCNIGQRWKVLVVMKGRALLIISSLRSGSHSSRTAVSFCISHISPQPQLIMWPTQCF